MKMMRTIKFTGKNFQGISKSVARSVKNGGVIICPTDTVYGLICDAANKKAVDKLFRIKKRPAKKSVPIFVETIKMAESIAKIDQDQKEFLKKMWPGRVTAVFERKPGIRIYGVNRDTVALRIPSYKLVSCLVGLIGPLTGTSANISGKPASGQLQEILKQFEDKKYKPDLIVDMGNLPKAKPSKIIDLTVTPYKVLRP